MNEASLDSLINHVVGTLPDSIAERKKLLVHALAVMPKKHKSRQRLQTMLDFLLSHEQQQLEFSLHA